MQTSFAPVLLADPAMAESESVIRKCVHCGFCTATCPTYVLLGDERDSPRGRIYMMKEMLENGREPTPEVVKHVDRCLSCLACMTTCPSSVNYMHLVDHARAYIEEHYRRPWPDRAYRALLAFVLPHQARFRLALQLARFAKFLAPALDTGIFKPLAAMLRLAPDRIAPSAPPRPSSVPAAKGRVAMLQGCAEPVLRPEIRAATIRLINRAGYDLIFAQGEGCCGALVHHMGRETESLDDARRNVDAWTRVGLDTLDAIVITASGCGTTIKEYGFMLRDDPAYAERAAAVSALAVDVSEFLARIELPAPTQAQNLRVTYHAACSLQHGQRIVASPKQLLEKAGFTVAIPAESHLCCGSAGVYNILQPEIAAQLGERKVANLERTAPQVIATGNIGCATQIGQRARVPVVHTVELLDWATGGPAPVALQAIIEKRNTQ